MNETDKAWLAGFIDGEGCVNLQLQKVHNRKYYFIRVQITQTHEDVLRHVCKITGVNRLIRMKRYGDNQADAYKWDADMKDSKRILAEILPYLQRKKEVAALALEYIDFWYANKPPKKERGKPAKEIDYSKFDEYKQKFHFLNARGRVNR